MHRWTAGVRREVLPSGLRVLVQRDDSAPVAAVVTQVCAGFFDEPDAWTGISHVVEHMFFKGTARRGLGAIARETKAAGGYLNASTSYDHTAYLAVLPSRAIAAGVDIQADALINSEMDGGELARELQVIIQEAKRKLDNPGAVTHETLHEVMFDHHRIRRWRIGYEADLARLTREDVWRYYRSRYVPERTIVAIVGAVEEEEALALARKAYGRWPAAPGAIDRSPDDPPRIEVRARTLRGDLTQAELSLGWRGVPPLHPDSAALDLAAAVLATGRGSWLYRALRETGLATSVGAHNYAPTELGVFAVTAELDPRNVDPVLRGTAEELARLSRFGPSPEDLERARTLYLTRWARRLESMEGRAAALAAAEALDGFEVLDREYQRIISVTPDDVRAVASRWLRPDSLSGVAYLPEGSGADLTAAGLERAFTVPELKPPTPPAARRPVSQPPTKVRPVERSEVWHSPLPGADLLVRRKPGVPTVTLGIYVPRVVLDPTALAGLGALTTRSAVRGAGGLDTPSLAFAFEELGGTLGSSAALDWLGFATTVMSDRLAEAAGLLDLVFTAPNLEDSDIAAERSLLAEEATQVADDMFRYPFQLAFRAAFGDQGYGLPASGLPETIRAIGGEDVRGWHQSALMARRPVVVAVGDLEPARASDELAGVFSGYPNRTETSQLTAQPWLLDGKPVQQVVQRQKAQSALAMVFPGPARRDPTRFSAEVWAAVASGLGGRLFEALRDRRSLAYTVMASSWQKGRAGALVTYIATSPERESEAREVMLAELARFAGEPVTDAELRQAQNYLAGQAEVNRQHGSSLAAEILEAWLVGSGLDELVDPGSSYRSVTAEPGHRVASKLGDRLASAGGTIRAEGVVRGSGGGK